MQTSPLSIVPVFCRGTQRGTSQSWSHGFAHFCRRFLRREAYQKGCSSNRVTLPCVLQEGGASLSISPDANQSGFRIFLHPIAEVMSPFNYHFFAYFRDLASFGHLCYFLNHLFTVLLFFLVSSSCVFFLISLFFFFLENVFITFSWLVTHISFFIFLTHCVILALKLWVFLAVKYTSDSPAQPS